MQSNDIQSKNKKVRVMAIDYGDVHTGVAVSDVSAVLAGYTSVVHTRNPEEAARQIAALAEEREVGELVLGNPKNMDGTPGSRNEKVLKFAELLEEYTKLPVSLWDERRSTIEAHQILMENGVRGRKRKKVVDAVAAALILEGYLTWRKNQV